MPELSRRSDDQFPLQAQDSFSFLEFLVDDAAEDHALLAFIQVLRGEVDATLGQLGEIRFVRARGQELVGVLRCQPYRETPRPALPR